MPNLAPVDPYEAQFFTLYTTASFKNQTIVKQVKSEPFDKLIGNELNLINRFTAPMAGIKTEQRLAIEQDLPPAATPREIDALASARSEPFLSAFNLPSNRQPNQTDNML